MFSGVFIGVGMTKLEYKGKRKKKIMSHHRVWFSFLDISPFASYADTNENRNTISHQKGKYGLSSGPYFLLSIVRYIFDLIHEKY